MLTSHRVSAPSRLLAVGAAMAFAVASCGGGDADGGSEATVESWCEFAAEADVVDDVFDSLGDDPSQVEAGLKRVEEIVARLPGEAPPEIAESAKALAEVTQMLTDAFADADYRLLDVDMSFLSDPDLDSRLDTANDDLDDFTQTNCGRSFGGDDSSDDVPADPGSDDDGTTTDDDNTSADDDIFDPASGTLREQLIVQFESIGLTTTEATCIADSLDFTDPSVQSGDIGAMLDFFEECGIGLDRLAELGG